MNSDLDDENDILTMNSDKTQDQSFVIFAIFKPEEEVADLESEPWFFNSYLFYKDEKPFTPE